MKLKKGDSIIVIAGKYKGKAGTINSTQAGKGTVIVDGINISKKHQKQASKTKPSGIFEVTKPIDASNVAIQHPSKKDRGSRIGIATNKSGSKTRVYRQASNKEIK